MLISFPLQRNNVIFYIKMALQIQFLKRGRMPTFFISKSLLAPEKQALGLMEFYQRDKVNFIEIFS